MSGPSLSADRIEQILDLARSGVAWQTIANEHNFSVNTVRKYCVQAGIANPSSIPLEPLASGAPATSTLVDADGNTVMQWIKKSADQAAQEEIAREVLAAMAAKLPRIAAVKAPRRTDDSLHTSYVIGDHHHGMRAWEAESGEDWDLDTGRRFLCAAMDELVQAAPPSEECLILEVGDYYDIDDSTNQTPKNKHVMDVSAQYRQIIRVGIDSMRYLILRALQRHSRVRVRCVGGNHDPHAVVALTEALRGYYDDEPRVTIEDSPAEFWAFKWEQNLVGVHHGHKIKAADAAAALPNIAADLWGPDQYRTVWYGHIHHAITEHRHGVTTESFRPLIPSNAYSAGLAYKSWREMNAVVLCAEGGEITRHRVPFTRVARRLSGSL